MEKITKHMPLWLERFRDSATSCALVMSQGDASVISIGHLLTAVNTGFISAVAATIVLITKPNYLENKYIIAGVTGLCTAIADIIVHPSNFGGFSTEAIVTGIGAGLLTLAFAKIKNV